MAYRKDTSRESGRLGVTRERRFPKWRRARPVLEGLEQRLVLSVGGGWISSTQLGQSGDGFLGQYYDNATLSGTPSFTRWDDQVDFDWTDGNADPSGLPDSDTGSVGPDNWSAEWTGTLTANFSETYTFVLNSAANGVRLWVVPVGQQPGAPIINDWTAHGQTSDTATMTLTAGQDYNVELEVSETTAVVQQIQLQWSSASTPIEDIGPATEVGLNVDGFDALFANMVNGGTRTNWGVRGTGAQIPTDANFWPEADGTIFLGEGDTTTEAGGSYLVQFTGMATVTNFPQQVDWIVNGTDLKTNTLEAGEGYNASTNTTTATMVVSPSNNAGFYITFTNTSRSGNSPNTITAISESQTSGTVTVSESSVAGIAENQEVTISGFIGAAAGYDGTFVVTSVNTANDTFTYQDAISQLPSNPAGGTALVNPENGITNLYVMQPTTLGGSTPIPVGTLFTPSALSMFSQYTVLRFMGLDGTNGNLTSDWSDRALVSDNFWSAIDFNDGTGVDTGVGGVTPPAGVPWEIQVALANETGKDIYMNIPSNASPSYINSLADLFAYGSNGITPYTSVQSDPIWKPLDSNLKVYIEFSNETWNSSLTQAESRSDGWANQLSQRALYDYLTNDQDDPLYPGGGSNAVSDGALLASYYDVNSTNDSAFLATYNPSPAPSADGGSPAYFSNAATINGYLIGQGWIGLRDVQISDAFKTAFGETSIAAVASDSRIRPVLEWQNGGSWSGGLGFIEGVYGAEHPVNYYLYGAGGTWYDGNSSEGFSDVSFANPSFMNGLTGWSSSGSAGVVANGSSMANPNAPPLFSAIAVTGGAKESGNTVTITTSAPNNFAVGQSVVVSGVTVSGYNGTFKITAVTSTTFSYVDSQTGLAASGDGDVAGTVSSGKTAYLQPGASLSQNVTFSGGYADITLYASQTLATQYVNGLSITLTPINGGPAINNGQPISQSQGAPLFSNSQTFSWDMSEAFYTGASDYTYTITFKSTLPSGTIFFDTVAIQTVNGMFDETTAALQSTTLNNSSTIQSSVSLALEYGLYDVGYEGGYYFNQNEGNLYTNTNIGFSSAAPTVGAYASVDPRTEQLAIATLDYFYGAGGALPIMFESSGNINSWAVAAPTYFNWNTPKQQAAASVEQTTQRATYGLTPGEPAGLGVASAAPGQVSSDATWLVPLGSYSMTVTFGNNTGAQAGQTDAVDVLLDGSVVATITVPASTGGTFTVLIGELTAGQYSVEFLNAAPAGSPSLEFGNGSYTLNQTGSTPYGGTAWPVPGIIQAENFDNGGENVSYYDPYPGNVGGAYRNTDIAIQATGDVGGGYNVGWIYPTEWLNYTINVATTGTYVLGIRVASGGQGGTFNVDFNGVNETGTMTVPNTGGWQTYVTLTVNVQLTAGQQIMQIDFDSTGATAYAGNVNWLQLTAASMAVSAGSNFSANAGASATFAGTVSGGTGPYTYGWTFGDGGTSSGSLTPSHVYANPGTYTATLTAQNNVGDVGNSSVTVTVNDVPPTVSLSVPGSGEAGVATSFTASATDISPADQAAGFTYSWNFGDGDSATGADPSHTFAAAGTYTVTVTATDEYGQSGTASGTIIIGAASTPYGGTAWPVPGIIQAENFDNGGENVSYYDPYPGNVGGAYRNTDIAIQATGDVGGGYNVGWIYPTEWLNYTINVATTGTYVLGIRVASGGQGGTFNVDFNGVNETGTMTVPNTGGWQTYVTLTVNVQLTAGQQIMQIDFDSTGATAYAGNVNWLQLTAVTTAAMVNGEASPDATGGAAATFAGSLSGGLAPLVVPVAMTPPKKIAAAGSAEATKMRIWGPGIGVSSFFLKTRFRPSPLTSLSPGSKTSLLANPVDH